MKPFSPAEVRWARSLAYDDYDRLLVRRMARLLRRKHGTVQRECRRQRHILCVLKVEPERYADRLVDGVYYENGWLFREVAAAVYAAA